MTKITIDEAAAMIVALDREALAHGEPEPDIPETLRRLPRLGYQLSSTALAAAFRRVAALHDAEADALEAETTTKEQMR